MANVGGLLKIHFTGFFSSSSFGIFFFHRKHSLMGFLHHLISPVSFKVISPLITQANKRYLARKVFQGSE